MREIENKIPNFTHALSLASANVPTSKINQKSEDKDAKGVILASLPACRAEWRQNLEG